MAGGLDSLHKSLHIKEKLKPATTSLQNCLKFSRDFKHLGLLCDFGLAIILKLQGAESNISTSPEVCVHKKLEHGLVDTLEGQSWSPDGGIYAVIGCKAYLYQVSSDFNLIHTIPLYYIPKDITTSTAISMADSEAQLKYKTAIAGPNGVEIYDLEMQNSSINVKEGLHLHADLAIVLVDFSPDLQYLAVAALDCHFGIWNVQSLQGEQKDFWYKHLSTVRVTNMAFSHDSQSIAVACWDGVCYIYTKAQQSTAGSKAACQWTQCHHIVQSSGERVCGLLTGSLVCWAPDSKSVRFSFANEEGSWLNTLDVETGKSYTARIPGKGIEAKGLESFRYQEEDFSICYLSSQQLLISKWAIQDIQVMSIDSPKEFLVYEDLMSSLWLVQDDPPNTSGMTLRWCRYGEAECQQVKNICDLLSVKSSIDDEYEKCATGVCRDGLPAEKSHWDSDKRTEKEKSTKDKESSSALSSLSSSSSRHQSSASSSSSPLSLSEQSSLLPSSSSSSSSSSPLPLSSTVTSSSSPVASSSTLLPFSSSSNDIISAPFYEPSTLLSSHSVSNPRHLVLASRMCVVLVILPSVAYVYYQTTKQWKSIVLSEAVTRCCLIRENILVTSSAHKVLRAWQLTSDGTFKCLDSLQIQGLLTERAFVVGDVYLPLVLVFDVDTQGEGHVSHVTMQDDKLVLTKKSPVCVPTLWTSCSSMFGVCVFFNKETSSCSLLVPEVNKTYVITSDVQRSSLYQCITEKKQDLLGFFNSNQQS